MPPENDLAICVVPRYWSCIKEASLDVHLGNWFVLARRVKLPFVDLAGDRGSEILKSATREEVFVRQGENFLIHPGALVLGVTEEFIALPKDVMAFVEGKSSLGRQGLIVATAAQVAPGFHGSVVLELANAGTVPVQVTPGMEIAQLVFQTMSRPLKKHGYKGKYYCQIRP